MLTEKRQDEIVKLVNERGSITLQELLTIFQISESTIRRDITSLDKEGRLTKVFGGAVANQDQITHFELSVSQKEEVDMEEKRQIARFAASLVAPDDFVYIDAGTSTGNMLEFLEERQATYVTNAVDHAKRLASMGFSVILIGGTLKSSTEAVVGAEAVEQVRKYHFSKGFFGTNGIHQVSGLTTPDINEALLKEAAMENTQKSNCYVLCANSKFGQISSVTFSDLEDVTILTDKKPEDGGWKKVNIIEAR